MCTNRYAYIYIPICMYTCICICIFMLPSNRNSTYSIYMCVCVCESISIWDIKCIGISYIMFFPHITVWGSCFSLCTRRSFRPPFRVRPPFHHTHSTQS